LRLHAQPIVDTATGEVAGYELLARFPQPWGVSPQQVFDAAATHAAGSRLTCAVLTRALSLRDALPPRTFVTVNCTPQDLTDPMVLDVLDGADLTRVFVELTEAAWPRDEQAVLGTTALIRRRGGRIACDDVGAGYAGLLQLIRLRPDLVKVDRGIVERVDLDPAAAALISMLGALAGRLDAWLVAEGIETARQLETLVGLGVPLAQGYYLARPADPWPVTTRGDEIRALHRRSSLHEHLTAYRREPEADELVLDSWGRVESVLVPGPDGRPVATRPLTMAPSTTVDEAVLRAMARPTPWERIAPLVLTDESGRHLGVVQVERLVEVLGERSA
jgi:EAL domain-containing protein (putative c-di-GMP-specific phosphodiesterase class I)